MAEVVIYLTVLESVQEIRDNNRDKETNDGRAPYQRENQDINDSLLSLMTVISTIPVAFTSTLLRIKYKKTHSEAQSGPCA